MKNKNNEYGSFLEMSADMIKILNEKFDKLSLEKRVNRGAVDHEILI